MKKSKLRKVLVLGIIVLFVGASVTPRISGNIPNRNKNINDNRKEQKPSVLSDISENILKANQNLIYDQIDQSQTQADTGVHFDAGCPAAQSFRPSLNLLTKVELFIHRSGNPTSDLVVSIRSSLTGNDLTSFSLPAQNIPSYNDWVEFDFPDITVNPGQKYYIIWTPGEDFSHQDGKMVYWWGGNDNPYPLGEAWHFTFEWHLLYESSGFDFCFITYGPDGNQPYYFIHLTDTHIEIDKPAAEIRLQETLNHIRTFDPKPAFLVISGDLVEDGNHGWPLNTGENYDIFKGLFYGGSSMLYLDASETIPVYICPGNHDHRWGLGLTGYDNKFNYPGEWNNHCYDIEFDNTRILSMDTGSDKWVYGGLVPPGIGGSSWVPESNGLSPENINWLNSHLGLSTNDVIFFHHPWINYYDGDDGIWGTGIGWGEGCFYYQRDNFRNLMNNYHVPLVLSGHIHWNQVYQYRPGYSDTDITYHYTLKDDNGWYYETKSDGDYWRTLNVQTSDHRMHSSFRSILVSGNVVKVYEEYVTIGSTYIKMKLGDGFGRYNKPGVGDLQEDYNISNIAKLHVYDSQGNHLGENESGGIDLEIYAGVYVPWVADNNTITMGYEAAVYYGEDDYIYEIDGVGNGSINLEVGYNLDNGLNRVITRYNNVSVMNGSISKIFIGEDTVDYTLFVDEDGDGVVDYELEPTEIETLPPFKPEYIEGQTTGKPGKEYSYSTSTSDPNADQIYYLWDWGDDTTSGWLGPFDSGEVAEASHIWDEKGDYEIKVKAKDIYDSESDWSDPLPVSMPRNKAFNFISNLFSWLFERFPNAFPILRHMLGL